MVPSEQSLIGVSAVLGPIPGSAGLGWVSPHCISQLGLAYIDPASQVSAPKLFQIFLLECTVHSAAKCQHLLEQTAKRLVLFTLSHHSLHKYLF